MMNIEHLLTGNELEQLHQQFCSSVEEIMEYIVCNEAWTAQWTVREPTPARIPPPPNHCCAHWCTYMLVHACTCSRTDARIDAPLHEGMHGRAHVQADGRTDLCINICMHACTHARTSALLHFCTSALLQFYALLHFCTSTVLRLNLHLRPHVCTHFFMHAAQCMACTQHTACAQCMHTPQRTAP